MISINGFDISNDWLAVIVVVTAIDLLWKAVALWRAAHLNDKPWFLALLLINSAGVLPMIYLWVNSPNEIQTLNLHSHGPHL